MKLGEEHENNKAGQGTSEDRNKEVTEKINSAVLALESALKDARDARNQQEKNDENDL